MEKNKNCCNNTSNFGLYFGLYILMSILLFLLVLVGLNEYYKHKLIPFEIEGSCNTGFIGIDFQSEFKNYDMVDLVNEYTLLKQFTDRNNASLNYDFSGYNTESQSAFTMFKSIYFPKHLNLKNIDGLNCNFKVKGAIPFNKLQGVNW